MWGILWWFRGSECGVVDDDCGGGGISGDVGILCMMGIMKWYVETEGGVSGVCKEEDRSGDISLRKNGEKRNGRRRGGRYYEKEERLQAEKNRRRET